MERYTEAIRHYAAGALPACRQTLQRLLLDQPDHAHALQLLAVVAQQDGDAEEATQCFRHLLQLRADDAEACYGLGLLAESSGLPEQAEIALRQALAGKPEHPEAWHRLGELLRRAGRPTEAAAAYRKSVQIAPQFVAAHVSLGHTLLDCGRRDEAEAELERAFQLEPQEPQLLHDLALGLERLGRWETAEALYRWALVSAPDALTSLVNLGNALKAAQRPKDAEAAYRRALRLQPDSSEGHNNLALLLMEQGRLSEAEAAFQRALYYRPEFGEAVYNLSCLLKNMGRMDESAALCERALRLMPDYAEAHNHWAVLTLLSGFLDAAETACRRALLANPAHKDAAWNLSLIALLQGNFDAGWDAYEFRWEAALKPYLRTFSQPLWDGRAFRGQTLLIHCEQGSGDCLQFIRYLPLLKPLGGRVLLECPTGLTRLFAGVHGIDAIIPKGERLPDFDCYCPLLSLPSRFGTRLESIPAQTPYLKTPAEALESAPALTAQAGTTLKVGLVWAGNPGHSNDLNRSIGFDVLWPLLAVPGITWVILQKERRPEHFEALAARHGWLDPLDGVGDFADTAAIVQQLDLVIGVDTAVIHLAGALGKTTWALIPVNPDWRWMLEREDSPWYPSMRLFRQARRHAWPDVIEQAAAALAAWADTAQNESGPVLEASPLPPPDAPKTAVRTIHRFAAYQRLVEARHGTFLYNANDRYVGHALETYGEYSEHETALLLRLLRPGDVVIEAGANIGALTVPLARAVGPEGLVLAFEPLPVVFHTLCANLALNALENTRAYPYALGRYDGDISIPKIDYAVMDNFGGKSPLSADTSAKPGPLTAPITRLDGFCKDLTPRLVKIDVEGMETEVLIGATELIRRARPLLYVENDRVEQSPALIRLLRHLGYRLYWHTPPLFNPNNHFGYIGNLYGATVSINMLCIPVENPLAVRGLTEVGADYEHPLIPMPAG